MKRLSLKRSLELCKELWSWFRDNPDMVCKNDWPKWNRYPEVENRCFACEYDLLEYKKQHIKDPSLYIMSCSYCPLKGLWGSDCTDDNSPYKKWCSAETLINRRRQAQIIVNFCDKKLKKLAKKEK